LAMLGGCDEACVCMVRRQVARGKHGMTSALHHSNK
jgi:hypothetical protein